MPCDPGYRYQSRTEEVCERGAALKSAALTAVYGAGSAPRHPAGNPKTRKLSSNCGLMGRLSRTPEGKRLRNHFS
jgi:hypothetical protein